MIEMVQIGILVALSIMALVATVNVLAIRSLRALPRPGTFPKVSVLIPARNEEENLGWCIESLVEQEYPNFEILVLDDNSTDATAAIVQKWEQESGRVRYVKGAPLPPGWVGKNFACHQLSRTAQGDLLLFIDADTRLSREALVRGVAAVEHFRADLLTVLPDEIMQSFWEKTLLPLLHFNLLCFLPIPFVSGLRDHRFAMANGQFMLFRRKAYDAVGGHQAVKDVMVEDVWLSRLIKKSGFRLRILDGRSEVACRMYSSFKGIWDGFSKNLFAGFRFSVAAIVTVIVFNFATSVFPFVSMAAIYMGWMQEGFLSLVIAQIAIVLGIRILFASRFKMSYVAALLHPLAVMIEIGMAANSARWVLVAGGAKWKGRAYGYKKEILATIRGEQ
jgi:chlorobactene glucosyltransferase